METRIRPVNYTSEVVTENVAVYYSSELLAAIGYYGKRAKRSFHFRFHSAEAMMEYINKFVQNVERNFQADKERREKARIFSALLKASDHFSIGDVIYNSWGYEQTNIDFYQVTDVLNKKIRVRAIGSNMVEPYSGYSGKVMPEINAFKDGHKSEYLLSIKADDHGCVMICNPERYYYFKKWDGTAKYCSWGY